MERIGSNDSTSIHGWQDTVGAAAAPPAKESVAAKREPLPSLGDGVEHYREAFSRPSHEPAVLVASGPRAAGSGCKDYGPAGDPLNDAMRFLKARGPSESNSESNSDFAWTTLAPRCEQASKAPRESWSLGGSTRSNTGASANDMFNAFTEHPQKFFEAAKMKLFPQLPGEPRLVEGARFIIEQQGPSSSTWLPVAVHVDPATKSVTLNALQGHPLGAGSTTLHFTTDPVNKKGQAEQSYDFDAFKSQGPGRREFLEAWQGVQTALANVPPSKPSTAR